MTTQTATFGTEPYVLGVDLGTTFTAAAVRRGDRFETLELGVQQQQMPSVLYLTESGSFVVGSAAEDRALDDPSRVAREFKRRIGDEIPMFVHGAPYPAASLTARLLRSVVDIATNRYGAAPAETVLSHPIDWAGHRLARLQDAAHEAGLREVQLCAEPIAAALEYAAHHRLEIGQRIAVYDLGGGTFDVCVIEQTADGFVVRSQPEGINGLGGIDFDRALSGWVLRTMGIDLPDVVDIDDDLARDLARFHRDVIAAKHRLSEDVEASFRVHLAGSSRTVRITRSEFERLARPPLVLTVDATWRALRSAGCQPQDLAAIVLIGGGSRMPLVKEMLTTTFRVPIAVDAHPKYDVALGSLRVAAGSYPAAVSRTFPPGSPSPFSPASPPAFSGTPPVFSPGSPPPFSPGTPTALSPGTAAQLPPDRAVALPPGSATNFRADSASDLVPGSASALPSVFAPGNAAASASSTGAAAEPPFSEGSPPARGPAPVDLPLFPGSSASAPADPVVPIGSVPDDSPVATSISTVGLPRHASTTAPAGDRSPSGNDPIGSEAPAAFSPRPPEVLISFPDDPEPGRRGRVAKLAVPIGIAVVILVVLAALVLPGALHKNGPSVAGLPSGPTASSSETASTSPSAGGGYIAEDDFARTKSNGWGSANPGGSWSLFTDDNTHPSDYTVSGGAGVMHLRHPTSLTAATLSSLSVADVDEVVSFSSSRLSTGNVNGDNGVRFTLYARHHGEQIGYYSTVKLDRHQHLSASLGANKASGTTETIGSAIYTPTASIKAGEVVHLRFEVSGTSPVALRAKVWLGDQAEPTDWQLSAEDATAPLTAPGDVGVLAYLSASSPAKHTDISVYELTVVPAS